MIIIINKIKVDKIGELRHRMIMDIIIIICQSDIRVIVIKQYMYGIVINHKSKQDRISNKCIWIIKHFLRKIASITITSITITIITIILILLTVIIIINNKLNLQHYHSNFVQIIKINIDIKWIKSISHDLIIY